MTNPEAVSNEVALAQIDRAFRSGLLSMDTPPTRFYINLSDLCNLRCRHCITQAPQHTAAKIGRVMSIEVIEALRPWLKHAMYVGFPHAGEPLLARCLSPLLRSLCAERQGQTTVVHLLTNGLLLTEARFCELVALGINSWSFSVDGMTAASHDALRQGSRIDILLPQLADLCELRRKQFPDVRMGIACTVHRANLHEIADLLRYAALIGLDWVKLEEMFPSNAFAADQVITDTHLMRMKIQEAVALAESLDLNLLLHLEDIRVFKCLLEHYPDMARFSKGDDWINRMDINPCRLPYELICVEPDGSVKSLDFYQPSVGNILYTDLMQIWNHRYFQYNRQNAISRRICQPQQPPICPSDLGPTAW
jgi:MoaA/NifB/PqqE/SkfB family radical SAM enzyme